MEWTAELIVSELLTPNGLPSGIAMPAVKFVTKVLVAKESARISAVVSQSRHTAPSALLARVDKKGRGAIGCTSLLKIIRRSLRLFSLVTSTRDIPIRLLHLWRWDR